jgi:hypothetical protein
VVIAMIAVLHGTVKDLVVALTARQSQVGAVGTALFRYLIVDVLHESLMR